MRKLTLLALIAASLAITACNTVSGAGKAVTGTAEDAKH
jgi:predicted small secreted protein